MDKTDPEKICSGALVISLLVIGFVYVFYFFMFGVVSFHSYPNHNLMNDNGCTYKDNEFTIDTFELNQVINELEKTLEKQHAIKVVYEVTEKGNKVVVFYDMGEGITTPILMFPVQLNAIKEGNISI